MGKNKCILFLIIAVIIIITSMNLLVFADNDDTMIIKVSEGTGQPGKEVTIDISLQNNPGISSMSLDIAFDSALSLTNIEYNSSLGGTKGNPETLESPVILQWVNINENWNENAIFATLTFVINGTAEYGKEAGITISFDSENIYNLEETNIPAQAINGKITVVPLAGDINNDSKVNNKDVTRLFQFLANWNVTVNEYVIDVNGDGKNNNKDISRLMQYLANWPVEIHPTLDDLAELIKPHKHSILECISLKSASCTEDGNIAYWYCADCGKYFSDAEGTTEITQESTVIKATGHKLTAVSAKEPTCTVAGNIAYWYCADCGKYFSDANGTTEITHNSTIIQAKHTYSTSWSTDAEHHWYTATCGHNVTSNYEEHSFDKNNKCTVCGYVKPNYKSVYLTYSEIGKTIDLINGSDFSVKSGAKRLFSDDIYYYELNCTELDYQSSEGKSYSSFESFSEQCSSSLSTKIGFGIGDIGAIQLMEVDLTASSSYERKKESETSEYVYSWSYLFNGKRVEISEFRDSAKLSKVLSPDFINDAKKLKDGKMSAAEFVNLWGTHVITSAIYGARIDVEYYEISNKKSEYESYKDTLDTALNSTINQIKLNVEMNLSESGISTSSDEDTLRKFSVKGISKNPLVCSSIDTLGTDLAAWRIDFANNVDDNSAIVDIGDAGLCCIWYLLDDSFNDVKIILDEYMKKECSALYDAYFDKINKLKIDNDIKFDNTTGTLTINLESYQKASQIDGFMTDSFVSYEDGIIKIKPYYNGNQIKNIIIKGLYGTTDSSGQEICSLISNVSVKLESGDWNNELNIELRNVGIAGSKGCPALDLSSLNSEVNVTLLCYGKNTIKAGENGDGINANKLTIQSDDINNVVYIYGGDGSKGSKGNTPDRSGDGGDGGTGNAGSKGGIGISASQINVSGEITVEIYGGTGGTGGTGGNSVNWGWKSKKSGGAGGTGGNGGNAVVADSLTVASESTLIVHGGNGGNGGNGGYRDTRYYSGNLGSGGAGGAGATAIVCTTVNGQYTYTNGANGSSGSTGGDWQSQHDYWNSAYWG